AAIVKARRGEGRGQRRAMAGRHTRERALPSPEEVDRNRPIVNAGTGAILHGFPNSRVRGRGTDEHVQTFEAVAERICRKRPVGLAARLTADAEIVRALSAAIGGIDAPRVVAEQGLTSAVNLHGAVGAA